MSIFFVRLFAVFLGCLIALPQILAMGEGTAASQKAMEYRLEGYRYQEKGDLDNAIIYYRKAVDEDGTYATAHNDLGVVYEQRGMYDAAERSYLRALKAHPDYKGSYSNLAYLYENKGDVDKSIYYWKKRLALESDGTSKWMQKGRSKLDELEQRRKVREMMTEDDKVKYKKYRYENKRQRKFKDWIPEVGAKKLDEEMGQRYFDQGIKFYNNHKYDEALSSFRMARTFNVKGNDVNRYMVRINKVKKALAASDITGEEVYSSVVPREDLLLSRDHFKMGLDYYGQQDYERAFSSFTMAMTYNPYDEVIHRYVEDSKIKIEEEKVKGRQLKQDARRANVARSKQPLDVQRDMVRTREDMVNRGYITTSEDMSVESFMADGRELFLKKRYADALYVWKQAMLLDVAGLYREELESLLDQAEIETSKERDRRLDSEANVTEESLLADVTRAAIPSEKGISDWALRSHRKVARAVIGESLETKAIRKKLQIRYTLNFKDASLKGVVDLLTELTGLNIVIDTKEIGTNILNENNISFRVADMALIKILEAVLRFTDFDYLIEGNLIWVTTKEKIRTEDILLVVYDVQDILGKIFDFPAEKLGEGFSRRQGSVGRSANE